MSQTVEFLFDFGSPASYLAHKRLQRFAARTGTAIDYRPILLGGVFKATGNSPPAMVAAKGRYMFVDLARYAARDGVPLAMNPFFPVNTILLMRLATALAGRPEFPAYVNAAFDAMWAGRRNLGGRDEVAAVLTAAGLDAAATLALAHDAAVKDRLRADTDAAVARGVFGAPTFFVGDDMFFGQDRLDWVEQAAAA